MKKSSIGALNLWQFDNLARQPGIRHFVTDRHSNPHRNDFTLSLSSSPDRDFVVSNRRMVARAMGVDPNRLFFPSQVHETRIVHVTSSTSREELHHTDALITNERGVSIAVMSADCVPILLYDIRNQAIAAVHSGWRGTVAKILQLTLMEMHRIFGTTGRDIIAGIGPSASVAEYEVGAEVIAAVNQAFESPHELLDAHLENKAKLDLWKANIVQLTAFGVPAKSIEVSDLCTIRNNEHFFSARKGDKGRFAAGIVLT